jgi:hypothetical protein
MSFLYCCSIQYRYSIMDRQEWVARCARRLHERWPRVPQDQLREVAAQLRHEHERQLEEPEHAAAEWLRLGMPNGR